MMPDGCPTGLQITLADWNVDRLSFACRVAAMHDRVEAIFPNAVILLPFAYDESQSFAFLNDMLAGRVTLGGVLHCLVIWLRRLVVWLGHARIDWTGGGLRQRTDPSGA